MKRFIYRLAALAWILNYPEANHLFDLESDEEAGVLGNELGLSSHEVFAISGLDLLDHIAEEYLQSWWDIITSWDLNPWESPWADNEYYASIAERNEILTELGHEPRSWTSSEHHTQWRESLLKFKGFVRD